MIHVKLAVDAAANFVGALYGPTKNLGLMLEEVEPATRSHTRRI